MRNALKRYDSYVALIKETQDYYKQNIPYSFIYGDVKQGKIDYQKRTFEINVKCAIVANPNVVEDVKTINEMLKSEKESGDWRLDTTSIYPVGKFIIGLSLVNKKNEKLAEEVIERDFPISGSLGKECLFSEEVSAEVDASDVYLKINSVKVNDKEVNIGIYTKDDFLENVVKGQIRLKSTGVAGVYVPELCNIPSYVYTSIYNIKQHFDYPELNTLLESKYKTTITWDIYLTKEDYDTLHKNKFFNNSYYITNDETVIPRDWTAVSSLAF